MLPLPRVGGALSGALEGKYCGGGRACQTGRAAWGDRVGRVAPWIHVL